LVIFNSIYYNNRSNKIHLVETIGGERVKYDDYYENTYYLPDPTGNSDITDIYGNSVIKKVASHKDEIKNLKDIYVQLSESDIDPATKFLQQRYGNVDLKARISDFNIAYIDIEISVESEFPKPEEAKFPINLISVKSTKTGKMSTFGLFEYTGDSKLVEDYHYCADELDLLKAFARWFRKQKFDIITGWNVDRFDMMYIMNRIDVLAGEGSGIQLSFSPYNKTIKKRNGLWQIAGISTLDYLDLYKNFTFVTEESYTLQAIGVKITGKGKIDLDGQINTMYKTDWNKFVEYNIVDVKLVEDIDNVLHFMELAITFCYQALIPFDKIFSSIATIEGYILRHLHKKNMVMPDRKTRSQDWWYNEGHYNKRNDKNEIVERQNINADNEIYEKYVKGGYVEANKGFYKDVLSFDVTSLYPHMIIQYNISPETKVIKPTGNTDHLIESEINQVYYKKGMGILPEIVESIFKERKAFKQEMFKHKKGSLEYGENDRNQHVRKILINSMYGVLINEYFHFYDVDNARAITRGGRVLIKFLGNHSEDWLNGNFTNKVAPKLFDDYSIEFETGEVKMYKGYHKVKVIRNSKPMDILLYQLKITDDVISL